MDHRQAPGSQSNWGDVQLLVGVHCTNSIRLDKGGDTGTLSTGVPEWVSHQGSRPCQQDNECWQSGTGHARVKIIACFLKKPDKDPLSDLELNLPGCAIITLLLLDLSCLDAWHYIAASSTQR